MSHSSLLGKLIDLNAALAADQVTPLEEKKRRDRAIGQAASDLRENPSRQIQAWLEKVRIEAFSPQGESGTQLYHTLCLVLVVAGLLAGWGLTRAVLHYTGDEPINIIGALALLVLPQILLLLLWIITMLPMRIPLLASLQSALRYLNPGRFTRYIAERLRGKSGNELAVLWNAENRAVMAPAARWLFSFWSQLFSVSFNVGVLLAGFYLVSFSDLAFAWSSTLKLDSAGFHALLQALSWPWQGVLPHAVPDAELVEMSRYYRLEDSTLAGETRSADMAAQLGQWWSFLLAAIVFYGLLPRIFTLTISWFRFRHHLQQAMPRFPGAPELLARMNSPLISTSAQQPEKAAHFDTEGGREHWESASDHKVFALVDWAGALSTGPGVMPLIDALGLQISETVQAGGTRSTQQDGESIDTLCRLKPEGVAVLVKSWEPPLLEFLDFLQLIRERCNRRQAIIVFLWNSGESVSERDRETWRVTLLQLKDPDLYTEVLESPA